MRNDLIAIIKNPSLHELLKKYAWIVFRKRVVASNTHTRRYEELALDRGAHRVCLDGMIYYNHYIEQRVESTWT